MHYRQFLSPKSGCASYLLGCGHAGVAAAIDPVGPVGPFLQEAEEAGCRITHIIETHAHADHRSSARELAGVTGADLCMFMGMPARFPFKPLDDGISMLDQAQALYASLFEKILPLGDALEIHPAHYGCSPCGGQNMSRKPFSTIGYERRFNLALQLPNPEAFSRFVLSTLRTQPEDFRRIKKDNLGWD